MLHDVSRDGRLLIHHGFEREGARVKAPGEDSERDLCVSAWPSTDGSPRKCQRRLVHAYGARAIACGPHPTRYGVAFWSIWRKESRCQSHEGFKFSVTPDGAAYAYCYLRFLQDLYLVEGLQ
jgi:hypothetical protein